MNKHDLLLHVDKTDGSLGVALSNAVHYAHALKGETYSMALVVNSRAVSQLKADENPEMAEPLAKAAALGLRVCVCANALRATGIAPEALFPQCEVVPAGIVALVNFQREGYAYVKA